MPICKRCGEDHFNFVACGDAPAMATRLERRKVRPVWQTPTDGRIPWTPSGIPTWGQTRFDRVRAVQPRREG